MKEATQFKKGVSGNPAGRPKGLVKASQLVQATAKRIATAPHPQAAEITERTGIKCKTYLDVVLLTLAKDDPKTFLAYYAGKPIESVDVTTNALPTVIDVKFINDNDDQPAETTPPAA